MEKKGVCRRKRDIVYSFDIYKVVYKITEENISVLKEYFEAISNSCSKKLEIGDLITQNLSIFDKDGNPKSFEPGRCVYQYNAEKKKNQIEEFYRTIDQYVFIDTEAEVKTLKKYGFCNTEENCVMIIEKGFPYRRLFSKKEFQKKYEIVEENLVEEK